MGRSLLILAVFAGLTYAMVASATEIRQTLDDKIYKVKVAVLAKHRL